MPLWTVKKGAVELLLSEGADVHAQDDEALRLASYEGHEETVELLLAYGADVNAQDSATLRFVAKGGYFSTVKTLNRWNPFKVGSGCPCTKRDRALRLATEETHTELLRLLFSEGYGVNLGALGEIKPPPLPLTENILHPLYNLTVGSLFDFVWFLCRIFVSLYVKVDTLDQFIR